MYMTIRIFNVALFVLLLSMPSIAEYISEELFVLPWGEGQNQLGIAEPYELDSEPDIGDTIVSFSWQPGGGPGLPMVDRDGNIYFISLVPPYFKGFRPDGQAFLSNMETEPVIDSFVYYDTIIFADTLPGTDEVPREFYVDSIGQLYFIYLMVNFLEVRGRDGHFIDRIYPCPDTGHKKGHICCFARHSGNRFSIVCSRTYTFRDGVFEPGGSGSWLAPDGYYYEVSEVDSAKQIYDLVRFNNPTIYGWPDSAETVLRFPPGQAGPLLALDDEMNFYFYVWPDSVTQTIQIYDSGFQFRETLTLLPQVENRYLWYIYDPFVNYDGSVYQFLCEDDGLHVVKWTKQ